MIGDLNPSMLALSPTLELLTEPGVRRKPPSVVMIRYRLQRHENIMCASSTKLTSCNIERRRTCPKRCRQSQIPEAEKIYFGRKDPRAREWLACRSRGRPCSALVPPPRGTST
jgi:hypothetical protein